jgi:hypothetical protein
MTSIYISNYLRSHIYTYVAAEQSGSAFLILMRVYVTLGSRDVMPWCPQLRRVYIQRTACLPFSISISPTLINHLINN